MIRVPRVDMYFDVTEDDDSDDDDDFSARLHCHLYLVTVSEIIDALESGVTEISERRKRGELGV